MSLTNSKSALLAVVLYRLGQVRQQLGFVAPLSLADKQEVQRWLPATALTLFDTMTAADQQHSLRVCRGLLERGCIERDMLAAALLHDVGKAQGRVPFWTRPVIVLGKRLTPRLLAQGIMPLSDLRSTLMLSATKTAQQGDRNTHRYAKWRRSLSYAWWHAEIGADLASDVGLSEQAIWYIRTHHNPRGPAALLHVVDEVS